MFIFKRTFKLQSFVYALFINTEESHITGPINIHSMWFMAIKISTNLRRLDL